MLAVAQRMQYAIQAFDIRNAYVTAALARPVFMLPPAGYERPGKVLQLRQALYGLSLIHI